VALRIARIETGNLEDQKSVGGGVSELRIFVGKGYRIYCTIRDRKLVILLCGGDKDSQSRDLEDARHLANGLPE
jgi:putative addiction module killer protein